jgi:hypothetical protein
MTTRSRWQRAALALALVASLAACGRGASDESSSSGGGWSLKVEPLASPAGAGSSLAPQLTRSNAGALLSWIERGAGDHSMLRFSERTSSGWSQVRTAAAGRNWFASWADAPSVLRLSDGTLAANWFVNTRAELEAYDLFLTYSKDEGRTWAAPFKPHRDRTQTQHGFASLFEMPDRGLGLVWLDGRDMENNTTDPEGGVMTLRFTSFDTAWRQGEDIVVNARVCECCQTAAAVTSDGVVAAFRDRNEREIRDIFVTRLDRGRWTSPQIVHADNWEVDTCPVNGPALSAKGRDLVAAWYSVTDDVGHAYVAFSHDAGNRWSAPIRVDEGQSVGYVDVELLDDGSAAATWVEFDDVAKRRHFKVRRVQESGQMSSPIDVAGAGPGRVSGYPRVARTGDELVFAWPESAESEAAPGSGQQVKTAVARLPRTTAK